MVAHKRVVHSAGHWNGSWLSRSLLIKVSGSGLAYANQAFLPIRLVSWYQTSLRRTEPCGSKRGTTSESVGPIFILSS